MNREKLREDTERKAALGWDYTTIRCEDLLALLDTPMSLDEQARLRHAR